MSLKKLGIIIFAFVFFGSFFLAFFGIYKADAKSIDGDLRQSAAVEELILKAKSIALYNDPYWKILLHYRDSESVISDKNFFFADDGKTNSEAELYQTIRAFFRRDITFDDSHPLCRYPARLKFITQHLGISRAIFPQVNCKDFGIFLNNISAKEIDIVFASENINNLTSMMGHIFLKIAGSNNKNHALGYFANYSSIDNAIFIAKALLGKAPGLYILEPYHKKITSYNFKQKRSLWEYKLKFSSEQINNLILHIWEMKGVNTEYSFINHNCGNALLYLLYAANPDFAKVDHPMDAPLDIVSKLYKENYIENINILPAANYKFRMLKQNFSSDDLQIIADSLQKNNLQDFDFYRSSQEKSNALYGLETVIDYKLANGDISQQNFDFMQNEIDKNLQSLPKNNLKYQIKNPLNKNNSSRVVLGYRDQGYDRDSVNFGFYPVYNSLQDNNSEYFNEFELQLANLEGAYYTNRNKLRIDNFDVIKVKNLISYDSLVNGFSGNFRLNFERERFDYQSNKMFPNINFGVGIGTDKLSKQILAYSMISAGYSYFRNNNIAYANPEIGLILKEGNLGKLTTKYTKYFASNDYKYKDIIAVEQTFFVNADNLFALYCKQTKGVIEKKFTTIGAEYQYHF